jgi:hypothetical protein
MFTEKDVEYVLKFSKMIGRRNPDNHISNLTKKDVSIEETEIEKDTLVFYDAYIHCFFGVKSGIVPRIGKIYNIYVSVPRFLPGNSEPDDWDYEQIDSVTNLFDALKILYLYGEDKFIDNMSEGMHHELNQEQSQEQP